MLVFHITSLISEPINWRFVTTLLNRTPGLSFLSSAMAHRKYWKLTFLLTPICYQGSVISTLKSPVTSCDCLGLYHRQTLFLVHRPQTNLLKVDSGPVLSLFGRNCSCTFRKGNLFFLVGESLGLFCCAFI